MTETAQHTPGPWEAMPAEPGRAAPIYTQEGSIRIANVYSGTPSGHAALADANAAYIVLACNERPTRRAAGGTGARR